MPNPVQALVVGAGISGLTTAFALRKAGIDARIVEGASRPGGLIQSVRRAKLQRQRQPHLHLP